MRCDEFEHELDVWMSGDPPPGGADGLRRHAAGCARCRMVWDRAGAIREVLAGEADDPPDTPAVSGARARLREAFDRAGHPPIRFGALRSPVGPLFVGVTDRGVCDVTFGALPERVYRDRLLRRSPEVWRDDRSVADVRAQLEAYFSGGLTRFDLPVDLRHVTPFTRKVLRAAGRIRFGRVTSYGLLATAIGSPGASRAVGGALGRNPVPIIIPCHRVLARGGALGGFTGGLETKRALLRIEGHAVPDTEGGLFDGAR